MKIWIPEKEGIEQILRIMADKVRAAERIKDIEEWLDDELSSLECHVTNRASMELEEEAKCPKIREEGASSPP